MQAFFRGRNTNAQWIHGKTLRITAIKENQKTTMRFPSPCLRAAKIQKSTHTKHSRECEEKGTLTHCFGGRKLIQLLWKSVWKSLRNLKTVLHYNLASPLLRNYPKSMKLAFESHMHPMFIAAQCTTVTPEIKSNAHQLMTA